MTASLTRQCLSSASSSTAGSRLAASRSMPTTAVTASSREMTAEAYLGRLVAQQAQQHREQGLDRGLPPEERGELGDDGGQGTADVLARVGGELGHAGEQQRGNGAAAATAAAARGRRRGVSGRGRRRGRGFGERAAHVGDARGGRDPDLGLGVPEQPQISLEQLLSATAPLPTPFSPAPARSLGSAFAISGICCATL